MILLFIHQNFPAQYKHLVQHYSGRPEHRVIFITQSKRGSEAVGFEMVVYEPEASTGSGCHPLAAGFDGAVRNGVAVADVCRRLAAEGVKPDIICGHNGWGEMLFVKDVFPDTPMLSYFEFYYHAHGVDVDFDPEFTSMAVDPLGVRSRNAVNLLGFDAADWGNTPTLWQRQVHPPEFRQRLSVIHEGVDTQMVKPDPSAWLYLQRDGVALNRDSEVVTYVARNLEPYRGFPTLMRAAGEILRRRPQAHLVIVGGDEISYGSALPGGVSFREKMVEEVAQDLDFTRIHFLGRVAYDTYLRLLQVSSVHVYLTYPFVLSWSFIEALAAGCAIVGSATPPVEEVLREGENGLMVDFFSPAALADAVVRLLEDRPLARRLGAAARALAVSRYDLQSRQLPLWDALIEDLVAGRRPALTPG
jgi:glycosyltransferase involved in cell wall biosynthesis